MIVDIVVPTIGESIVEVEVSNWQKSIGQGVRQDDAVVDIESEKAAVEVPAPASGVLVEILKQAGEAAEVGDVIGRIDTAKAHTVAEEGAGDAQKGKAAPQETPGEGAAKVMPAARRALAESAMAPGDVSPTGPGGRLLKEDVLSAQEPKADKAPRPAQAPPAPAGAREEERVRMSPLRRTIAARLLEAKQSMAMLTTFNELDMSRVKALRKALGPAFLERHQIKLGFMSFFIRAAVDALKEFQNLNARIEEEEIVYNRFFDIGVAIGGGRGLVVPVIRNAETLGFAELERRIADLSARAKANALTPDELSGGTFTISNGGVYGSLMSTPIINPPQSGILGLHAIKDRPVVIDGELAVRPMMYAALSYDHRIVDGREAVTFLMRVKERIETPEKMMLEI
jgi:2-oxoglutarate dehydrogenase E2 component (dihydrolipoamide succinyltransferase)